MSAPALAYFAYGSNMDRAAMSARCPAATPLGVARLSGFRFRVNAAGWATILLAAPERQVWGLLWRLTPADEAALDVYEGVGEGLYTRLAVAPRLLPDDRGIAAFAYAATDPRPGRPAPAYRAAILAAAAALELPAAYQLELAAALSGGGPA